MTIHIAGLGPGDPRLLTVDVRELLESGLPVILRTRQHPTVGALAGASAFADCDDLYRGAPSFEAVYEAAAARVLDAASRDDVVYAVPGHPLAAELSVTALLA